jgi:hypothetical protein
MMTVSEKVAHLKGLIEGMELADTKEDKLIKAIADILEDMAYDLEDTQDSLAEVGEQVEMIDEDLESLENDYYDYDDDDDECGCGCCDDDECYEVTCPACGETICIDGDIADEGEMDCPNCGEHLEFDYDDEEEEGDEE